MRLFNLIAAVWSAASSLGLALTIAPNQYLLWGIGESQIQIPTGSVITEAVLTLDGLLPAESSFYVHLLDNAPKGLLRGEDDRSGNCFEPYGAGLQGTFEGDRFVCRFSAIDNPQSALRALFADSRTIIMPDKTSVTLSSAILELMDYAGNGRGFGIGIDTQNNSVTLTSIKLEITLRSITDAHFDSKLIFTSDDSGAILQRSWHFQDASLAGWQVVDEGLTDGPSRWIAVNGQLVQAANIYTQEPDASLSRKGTYLVYADGYSYRDCQVELDVYSADDDAFGIMFRYQDKDNYYRFSWDKERSVRRLVKCVNGTFTLLAQDTVPYTSRQVYHLAIEASGSSIVVFVDGQEVFSAADSQLSRGTIALYCWANVGAFYDNITVRDIMR